MSKQLAERNRKHGKHGTLIYQTWRSMLSRCHNPKNPTWPRYGGRGIAVCESWHDFPSFLRDMGERPEGTTIDRIDVNGDYEPGNCRWATHKTQSNNRRCTFMLTAHGLTRPLYEWCREYGLKANSVWSRVHIYKWPASVALHMSTIQSGR